MTPLARLRQIPPAAWLALAAAAGVAVLVVHRYCQDDEDTSWLNPVQPGLNLDVVKNAVYDVREHGTPPQFRADKAYPSCLAAWDQSWVGDC